MSSPILWYKGENNSIDSASGKNALWNATPVYVDGMAGQAFDLSHASTLGGYQLSVSNDPLFNFSPTSSFSIRFWIKRTSGISRFIYKGLYYGSTDDWGVTISSDGRVLFRTHIPGSSYDKDTGIILSDNNWHDCIIVYNNGHVKAYKDSVEVTIGGLPQHLCGNTNVNLYFGHSFYDAFTGYADEIRFYNTIITPSNIDSYDVTMSVVINGKQYQKTKTILLLR